MPASVWKYHAQWIYKYHRKMIAVKIKRIYVETAANLR